MQYINNINIGKTVLFILLCFNIKYMNTPNIKNNLAKAVGPLTGKKNDRASKITFISIKYESRYFSISCIIFSKQTTREEC